MVKVKKDYLEMGYIQLKSAEEDMDTLYKQFDNGNAWIVQFNEEHQVEPVGMVYLTKEQISKIFK